MCEGFVNLKLTDKLRWSLPWLVRYPFWRLGQQLRSLSNSKGPDHIVFVVANHFEPGTGYEGLKRLEKWCDLAQAAGSAVRDHDGTPFRHTNFFPAEQYERPLLEMLASLQAEGLGEVEIHLHHGVERPDTADNTRRSLEEFRDVLAYEHKCLSRETPDSTPRYAFVHGNWALANSAGGPYCGVDNEMQILAETGCYADLTLPSVPYKSQVPRINSIYRCGQPLTEARPHRSGPNLRIGDKTTSPIIFTGPLVFDWSRRISGFPIPRVDDGGLAQNYPLSLERFNRWRDAGISIRGRREWNFIKLYSHGFFPWDQDIMIGEQLKRFMNQVMDLSERTGEFKIHFATAREAYNMMIAAMDGQTGDPHAYRDYQLCSIMTEKNSSIKEQQSRIMVGSRPDHEGIMSAQS